MTIIQTFKEKLDYACRYYSITTEELCTAIKINPLALHLHATEQRELSHNELVLLHQHFDLPGTFFTNDNIRYIDVDALPEYVQERLLKPTGKKSIMCYEVAEENAPDISHEQLIEILNMTANLRNK